MYILLVSPIMDASAPPKMLKQKVVGESRGENLGKFLMWKVFWKLNVTLYNFRAIDNFENYIYKPRLEENKFQRN